MHVISMLDNYRAMCAAAAAQGKYDSYKAYADKYPVLFGAVQKYLYQCPLEAMRDYIERADFTALLMQGEENQLSGIFDRIVDTVSSCSERLEISLPFDLYLGMELGNIGGASLPTDDGSHFVYIGVDRNVDPGFLETFVPHELHHLLRISLTSEKDSTTLTARMVTEGLASYCPVWLNGLPWNAQTVAGCLGVSTSQAQYMLDHASTLTSELLAEGDVPLDRDVMARYFTSESKDDYVFLPGYFVGLWITHSLTERGLSFMDLTEMNASTIIKQYLEI